MIHDGDMRTVRWWVKLAWLVHFCLLSITCRQCGLDHVVGVVCETDCKTSGTTVCCLSGSWDEGWSCTCMYCHASLCFVDPLTGQLLFWKVVG